jgi:hypothetical protein
VGERVIDSASLAGLCPPGVLSSFDVNGITALAITRFIVKLVGADGARRADG